MVDDRQVSVRVRRVRIEEPSSLVKPLGAHERKRAKRHRVLSTYRHRLGCVEDVKGEALAEGDYCDNEVLHRREPS